MELPVLVIIGAAIPVFLLLILGMVLRRTDVLSSAADGPLMKLVVRVFYPCLFLDFIIGNPAVKEAPNLVAAPLIGFLTISGGFVIAYFAGRAMGLVRGEGLRSFAFCNGIYNYGYIPIPLILVLFDDRRTLGVLLVHNVGVEVALWTVGVLLLVGRFEWAAVKRLFNPPVMALLAALCINALGWDAHIPSWMSRFFQMLGACTIPFGILLAGTAIADLLGRANAGTSLKVPVGAVALRLGVIPVVFVMCAALLPFLSPELRLVMVIQAAMPAGIFPIVLVRHYGGDTPTAVRVVLATTALSVVTMPFWIRFGSGLLPG
jgi:hypothetical protein